MLVFALMASGAGSVVIFGMVMMPVFFAGNWDILLMVIFDTNFYCSLYVK